MKLKGIQCTFVDLVKVPQREAVGFTQQGTETQQGILGTTGGMTGSLMEELLVVSQWGEYSTALQVFVMHYRDLRGSLPLWEDL